MRFGPKEKFWVVTDPTPVSELGDVLFEASLADLLLQFKGGLRIEDNPTIYTDRGEAWLDVTDRIHRKRALAMAPISEEDRKRIMESAQKGIARWFDSEIAALCPEPCVCGRMPAVQTREDGQITLSCCDLEVARPTVGRCAADRLTLDMINAWNVLVRSASRGEVARLRSRVRELEELLGTAGAT